MEKIAFNMQDSNLMKMSLIMTKADQKAVKRNDSFMNRVTSQNRITSKSEEGIYPFRNPIRLCSC